MTTLLLEVPAEALACPSPVPVRRLGGVAVPRLVPGLGFGCGGRALLFHRLVLLLLLVTTTTTTTTSIAITITPPTRIPPIIATAEGAFIEKR